LASSTRKKVVVRRFDRHPLVGFVEPQSYHASDGIELLEREGGLMRVPYGEVKLISFVRDFDAATSEASRKTFLTRPKTSGLWVRLRFRDEELMEGILPNNLLLVEPFGFEIVPPDANQNQQKVFVPREALLEVQVLGVVGSPLKPAKRKPVPPEQIGLFDRQEEAD